MSVGGCRRINKVIVFDFCLITTSPSLFFCLGRSSYWLRPLFLSAMEKCPENAGKRQVAPKAAAVLHYWFRLLTAPSRDRSPPNPNMEIIPFLSGSVRPIGLKTHQKPRKVLFRGHFFYFKARSRGCGNVHFGPILRESFRYVPRPFDIRKEDLPVFLFYPSGRLSPGGFWGWVCRREDRLSGSLYIITVCQSLWELITLCRLSFAAIMCSLAYFSALSASWAAMASNIFRCSATAAFALPAERMDISRCFWM